MYTKDFSKSVLFTVLVALPLYGWCFDDDIAINEPNFNPENFLDLKTYEFRKTVEEEWQATSNGWRMAGGSLGLDESYIDSELKLNRKLSDKMAIRVYHEHQVYYDRKPVQHPLLEIAVTPLPYEITYSLLGTTAYDKRQADLGFALGFGDLEQNYLHIARLSIDHFYNDKNIYDDSYYERKPQTTSVKGSYKSGNWQTRIFVVSDKQRELVTPSESEIFQHHGDSVEVMVDYHYAPGALVGITYKGWQQNKALAEAGSNRDQSLKHALLDFYWVTPMWLTYELTVGARVDHFKNELRDLVTPSQNYDYIFETAQAYAILHYDYSEHAGWELGTYIGNTWETRDYLFTSSDEDAKASMQGKFRTSWEYHSADKKNRFSIHMTFNLDNLYDDPGDGAGMSYQGVF